MTLLREVYPPSHPRQQPDAEKWPTTLKVLPHVLKLEERFGKSGSSIKAPLRFIELLADVGGMELYDRGVISDAKTLLKTAEKTLDYFPESSDKLRGNILTSLGLCTDTGGISERSEGLEKRQAALNVRHKVFAKIPRYDVTINDEIMLYNAEADLACSLQNLNRIADVAEICGRCGQQYLKWGREKDFGYEYAKYYNHMAYVLLDQDEPQEATKYAKHGYDLMSTAAPNTQTAETFRFDWANIMFQNGDHDRALEEHMAVLKSRKQGCGDKGLLTLQSRLNIGIIYYLCSQFHQAEYDTDRYTPALLISPNFLRAHRKWIRETLFLDPDIYWPKENVTRAKYYLSKTLIKLNLESEEGHGLESEAMSSLDEFLRNASWDQIQKYQDSEDYPILFDYIVPWECRLVVPRYLGPRLDLTLRPVLNTLVTSSRDI